jgi:hypothetical protein
MKEKTLRKDIWESANYAGLALGLVSVIYMYISKAVGTSGMSTGTMVLVATPLWIAKFAGCIFLMKFFMKKFASAHPEADNKDIFRMGAATALLSAFFYSALQFVDMVYISPEVYTNEIELAMQQYSSVMDSNSRNMMKSMIDHLPQLQFVWNLIYCFSFGTILSAILSRNIGNQDPFADYKPE